MTTYKTGDLKKGLKVLMDGEPWLITNMEFVKPGKGNALYKCKLKNLLKGNVVDRTYKGGDSLEAADVNDISAQYVYRKADSFVFMDNNTFEQFEVGMDAIGDAWKYLIEGMACSMTLYNGIPIAANPPNHVELKVEYCEPGVRGDTATSVTKPLKLETGAQIVGPAFVEVGDVVKVDTRTGEYLGRVRG